MRQALTAIGAIVLIIIAGIAIWKQLNKDEEQAQPAAAATAGR